MKCPQCQFENREGAKFCKKCGAKLDLTCPQCGNILPPDSRFCDECGSQLIPSSKLASKELSFDEKLNRAIEIFTECGADGWQNKAKEEMAALA